MKAIAPIATVLLAVVTLLHALTIRNMQETMASQEKRIAMLVDLAQQQRQLNEGQKQLNEQQRQLNDKQAAINASGTSIMQTLAKERR